MALERHQPLYEYDEIAELLGESPENARQIATRAKKRLDTRERRFAPAAGAADDLAGRFVAACQSGDVKAVEAMLAADVVLYSDGGGRAFAARRPVTGVRRVANLLAVVFRKLRQAGNLTVTTVNGRPGLVFTVGDTKATGSPSGSARCPSSGIESATPISGCSRWGGPCCSMAGASTTASGAGACRTSGAGGAW